MPSTQTKTPPRFSTAANAQETDVISILCGKFGEQLIRWETYIKALNTLKAQGKKGSEKWDKLVERIWMKFSDVPMNPETECMEEAVLDFPPGTDKMDIWHWFDENHSRGVHYLLYEWQGGDA